jgi:signal transduction histidine kinase/ActR/RegA family two-component response regulator
MANKASTRLHAALSDWLVELTYEGIFATDGDLRVISWNRWMEIHTKMPASAVVGQPLLTLFPDFDARGLAGRYQEALDNGRVSVLSHGLHRYVIAMRPTNPDVDLAEMPQFGRISPLRDGDEIIGTVTTIQDVSDRLAAEAELRRQIAAQEAARDEAERALRAKDEFLSTLSHELRTPLNAVLGWTKILMSRSDADAAMIARALQVIERNASAQASMIDDILDVARMAAGKLRLEMQPTDLMQVILAAVDVVSPSASAKSITIRTKLDAKTPMVLGDPGRLQQVVWNLLSNAVKFSEEGGVIDVALSPAQKGTRLVVSDRGRGISREFLPFVFDRFRQSDASSARRQGGLGLGLALVRDLVQLHGGTIFAESRGDGKGAAFTIDLPVLSMHTTPDAAEPTGLPVPKAPSLAGALVLVVEDEKDSRDLLVAALAGVGADVVAVSSCSAALELLAASGDRRFDVLVSDIGMPEQDGYELMRRVRALHPASAGRIPAVAVTGYANADDRQRALAAGYQVHVPKPIDPMTFVSAVQRAVHEARM